MSLKGKKILLVDDDSDLRKIARHILESAGMIVDEAESVYEGLEKIKNSPPHVLLTDLHMPVETGFDLIEKLRSTGQLKKLPVIVLSSLNDVPNVRKAITLGVKDYVIKPIKTPVILRKLRKVLLGHDYVKIELPVPISADMIVDAQLSMIGEAGFQIQAGAKIQNSSPVIIESELLKEIPTKYQLSPLPRKYVNAGVYCNDFVFTGIKEADMQKIRTWVAQWRQNT